MIQCWDGSLLLVSNDCVPWIINGWVYVLHKLPEACLAILVLITKDDRNGNWKCISVRSGAIAAVKCILSKVHVCRISLKLGWEFRRNSAGIPRNSGFRSFF
jgi:hypothetical protein